MRVQRWRVSWIRSIAGYSRSKNFLNSDTTPKTQWETTYEQQNLIWSAVSMKLDTCRNTVQPELWKTCGSSLVGNSTLDSQSRNGLTVWIYPSLGIISRIFCVKRIPSDIHGLKTTHQDKMLLKQKTSKMTTCVTGQSWFQVNFDITYVNFQFQLSPSPRRQRKLRMNLG